MKMEEPLGPASDVPSNSQQLSYFVSFTVPQQKIRIRIPKLVAKTMRRKLSGYNKVVELEEVQDIHVADESKHQKERAKSRTKNLLPKRFYSIFCKVFGATFLSESKNDDRQRDCNQLRHQGEGVELKRRVFDFSHEFRKGLAYKNVQPFEFNGHGTGKLRKHDDKEVQNLDPLKWFDKHLLEMHQSLLGFFDKKNRWNFIRGKMNKENENPNLCAAGNGEKGIDATSNITSLGSSFRLVGRQKNRLRLHKVRSRIIITGRKLKMPRSLQRRFNKHYTDGEDGDDVYYRDKMRYSNVELCRKRILMGGKCRPLNSSGTLAYDKNGCLIPEAIP